MVFSKVAVTTDSFHTSSEHVIMKKDGLHLAVNAGAENCLSWSLGAFLDVNHLL